MRPIIIGLLECVALTLVVGANAQEMRQGPDEEITIVAKAPRMVGNELPPTFDVTAPSLWRDGENQPRRDASDARWKAAWQTSVAFHGAGSAFDAYTSYHRGPYESNSFLRDADGQFGNKASMIKAVSFVGITALQSFCVHKWPQSAKYFIPANAILGGRYFYAGYQNQQFLKNLGKP